MNQLARVLPATRTEGNRIAIDVIERADPAKRVPVFQLFLEFRALPFQFRIPRRDAHQLSLQLHQSAIWIHPADVLYQRSALPCPIHGVHQTLRANQSAASTSSACSAGLTLDQIFLILPSGLDQKGHARRALIVHTHEGFRSPDAVGMDNLFVLIRQQCERQIELGHKLVVGFDRVRAHSQHHRALLFKIIEVVPKRASPPCCNPAYCPSDKNTG